MNNTTTEGIEMGAVAGLVATAAGAGRTARAIEGATTGLQTGFGFVQHQQNAQAASLRGRFANDVAERNAQLAERQGEDALNIGNLEALRSGGETDQAISSGRASAGGQGVDINTGSAAAVRASQQLLGEIDALTIRATRRVRRGATTSKRRMSA